MATRVYGTTASRISQAKQAAISKNLKTAAKTATTKTAAKTTVKTSTAVKTSVAVKTTVAQTADQKATVTVKKTTASTNSVRSNKASVAKAAAAVKKAATATPKTTAKTAVRVSGNVVNTVKKVAANVASTKPMITTKKPASKTTAATTAVAGKVITTGAKVASTVKQNTAVKQPVQTVKSSTASTAKSVAAVAEAVAAVKKNVTIVNNTTKANTIKVSSGIANTVKNVSQKVTDTAHGGSGMRRTPEAKNDIVGALDVIQTTLDVAGLVPVVGEVADGVNGVIYLARGDYLNASLSLMAMVPFIGAGSTGGKLFLKGAKAIDKAKDVEEVVDTAKDVAKQVDNIKDATKQVDNIKDAAKQVDNLKDAAKQTDNLKDVVKQRDNVADATKQMNVAKGGANGKIEPSKGYDIDAKPSGKATKITDKMDDATKRSIMRENEAAETLAKNGYNIEQNPKVPGTTRNPDYIIEGEIFDCYSPAENTKIRNIASTIEEKVIKKEQTERIVLNMEDWKGNIDELIKQLNDYPI